MATGTNWIGAMLLAVASAVTMAADSARATEVPTMVVESDQYHNYDGGVQLVPAPEIADLEAHCLKTSDLPHHVGSSCSERLGRHFASTPIWEGAVLNYWFAGRSTSHRSVLNDRAYSLPYTRADLLLDPLPLWSDIFDGRIEQRIDAVARVFQDPVCAELRGVGGIRVELNGHCEARELFKYAAYLDACMTGLDRFRELHHQSHFDDVEYEDEVMDVSGTAEGVLLALSLVESGLQSMWVAVQCREMPSRMFDRDLRPIYKPDELGQPNDHFELAPALKPAHDAAMSIAARAGDPWAVQMFFVLRKGLAADVEYWKSLREFNPLLFHRWMAAHVGRGLGLSPQARALHDLKAATTVHRMSPDRQLESYLLHSTHDTLDLIDSSWRDGYSLPDASDLEESLVYPWDTETGKMLNQVIRSMSSETLATGTQDSP